MTVLPACPACHVCRKSATLFLLGEAGSYRWFCGEHATDWFGTVKVTVVQGPHDPSLSATAPSCPPIGDRGLMEQAGAKPCSLPADPEPLFGVVAFAVLVGVAIGAILAWGVLS